MKQYSKKHNIIIYFGCMWIEPRFLSKEEYDNWQNVNAKFKKKVKSTMKKNCYDSVSCGWLRLLNQFWERKVFVTHLKDPWLDDVKCFILHTNIFQTVSFSVSHKMQGLNYFSEIK